jgi:F-type H+-transporting ATPase subunit a
MFRLFGNIMAGHILVAVFLGLGVQMMVSFKIPVGAPLHFPFLFLEILVGTIQAFVFALLSTVYIGMMLPHEHEEATTVIASEATTVIASEAKQSHK